MSGYGLKVGRGRCYTLWRDFMACATKHGAYGAGVCQDEREDYVECLHHTKLVQIINTLFRAVYQLATLT